MSSDDPGAGIKLDAVRAANERMRSEVLPRLRDAPHADLSAGWSPWRSDLLDGRWTAELDTDDSLVLALMRDPALLARARAILRDELHRAQWGSEHTAALVGSLLAEAVGR
jgi:hypothetical protein